MTVPVTLTSDWKVTLRALLIRRFDPRLATPETVRSPAEPPVKVMPPVVVVIVAWKSVELLAVTDMAFATVTFDLKVTLRALVTVREPVPVTVTWSSNCTEPLVGAVREISAAVTCP